jgi:hypothetical protein
VRPLSTACGRTAVGRKLPGRYPSANGCPDLMIVAVDPRRAIGQQTAYRTISKMAYRIGDIQGVRSFPGLSLAGAGLLGCIVAVAPGGSGSAHNTIAGEIAERATDASFQTFLDRLMGAESAGADHAKNPRSTAVGPFQFIKATFLEVTRRHFPTEVAGLTDCAGFTTEDRARLRAARGRSLLS